MCPPIAFNKTKGYEKEKQAPTEGCLLTRITYFLLPELQRRRIPQA